MKQKSIYGQLVRSLSLSITSLIIVIFLITDLFVDDWVHDEFHRSVHSKGRLLTTLVEENKSGIELNFSPQFMPEFYDAADPEYYQIWRNGQLIERSQSLQLANASLDYQQLTVGAQLEMEQTLPDGRSGEVVYYRFFPHVDADDLDDFNNMLSDTATTQHPILLAYAVSTEEVNFLMSLIDISFFTAAILVAFIVRFLVKKAVGNGLQPLEQLSQTLKSISLADKSTDVSLNNEVTELIPIQDSINSFINENRLLYQKEQRLTSDLAHELKTPIAELLSLTEVSIKFPNDKNLLATYKQDIFDIGKRLDSIVTNILLFHRHSHHIFDKNDVFDTTQVLTRLAGNITNVFINTDDTIHPITGNLFAFESIFSNLLNNAETYREIDSEITVFISKQPNEDLVIQVSNMCASELNKQDLSAIFSPFWQKDLSRTSNTNIGLGLSIVQSFVTALGGQITVKLEGREISFIVILPTE